MRLVHLVHLVRLVSARAGTRAAPVGPSGHQSRPGRPERAPKPPESANHAPRDFSGSPIETKRRSMHRRTHQAGRRAFQARSSSEQGPGSLERWPTIPLVDVLPFLPAGSATHRPHESWGACCAILVPVEPRNRAMSASLQPKCQRWTINGLDRRSGPSDSDATGGSGTWRGRRASRSRRFRERSVATSGHCRSIPFEDLRPHSTSASSCRLGGARAISIGS